MVWWLVMSWPLLLIPCLAVTVPRGLRRGNTVDGCCKLVQLQNLLYSLLSFTLLFPTFNCCLCLVCNLCANWGYQIMKLTNGTAFLTCFQCYVACFSLRVIKQICYILQILQSCHQKTIICVGVSWPLSSPIPAKLQYFPFTVTISFVKLFLQ